MECNWTAAATAPEYLDGTLAGDYGWDPLALGAEKDRLGYYRQAELQNGRWASEQPFIILDVCLGNVLGI